MSVCLLLIVAIEVSAQQVKVDSVRYKKKLDYTRLVFDMTKPSAHQVFLLSNPARLVIDFKQTKLKKSLTQPPKNHALFSRVRSAPRKKNDLRVVFDLVTAVSPKSFALKPNKGRGHRLVVDLFAKNKKFLKPSKRQVQLKAIKKPRDIVIAVDAGHGGKDPGAHGPKGTLEKTVVFSIAKKLVALINKKQGMKAIMVRKKDRKIGLRRRMEIARKAKADLFVSIHADAFTNPKARGASVYTLSNRGASSEGAKWLAKRENAADFVGGLELSTKEPLLAGVLMEMSQTATKEASQNAAKNILKHFKRIGKLHKNHVQKAGFMVLKSPDIPSVLVETAFISNPAEERKLKSSRHQAKMAKAIFKGVVGYFQQYAPANTYFALNRSKRHIIARGDTLSGIAQQYGVSMRSIRSANNLASTQVQIGQVLKIPRG